MVSLIVRKVLKCLLVPRSICARALRTAVARGPICGGALVLGSILASSYGQDIPTGFKVDRYARVWERNPFTLVKATNPETLPSAFDKLYLASWLKVDGKEVVMVQNSVTNEVQKITASPNQNRLRLVEIHPNSDPKSVEVVISNGQEQGTVKFRFDIQPPAGQTPLVSAGQASNQIAMTDGPGSSSPAKLARSESSSASPSASPSLTANLASMHPSWHPRATKVHTEGAAPVQSLH
jgi:hypothetical protein